jgi:hypothetical protein
MTRRTFFASFLACLCFWRSKGKAAPVFAVPVLPDTAGVTGRIMGACVPTRKSAMEAACEGIRQGQELASEHLFAPRPNPWAALIATDVPPMPEVVYLIGPDGRPL